MVAEAGCVFIRVIIMFNYFTGGWSISITKAPSFKKAAEIQQIRAARVVLSRYINLALNRIDFEGLPDTISGRVLRESFLWYPLTCFFTVGETPIALPAVPGGKGWNPYGDFGNAYAFARNGRNYMIATEMQGDELSSFLRQTVAEYPIDAAFNGCIIRCNDNCDPFINTVLFYVEQVADLLRALEVQRILLKHPIGIGTTQKQRATALKYLHDIDENLPFTLLNQTSNGTVIEQAQVINLMQGGDVIKPTMEAIDWWENRYFAECGVQNAGSQVDKKGENLTTAELSTTKAVTSAVINIAVDFYNKQLETSGVLDLPGCENIRCVPGKAVDYETDDISGMDDEEPGDMGSDTAGDSIAD